MRARARVAAGDGSMQAWIGEAHAASIERAGELPRCLWVLDESGYPQYSTRSVRAGGRRVRHYLELLERTCELHAALLAVLL
jgi:hypothetical protein